MTGGAGADTFVIESAADTASVSPYVTVRDRITDFSTAQGDRIDLSAIDAMPNAIGNQMFSYIGSGNFTGAAGRLRFANGLVVGDLNGDRWSDFWFEVNAPTLAASDFIL
jgi:hypothetical protein